MKDNSYKAAKIRLICKSIAFAMQKYYTCNATTLHLQRKSTTPALQLCHTFSTKRGLLET